MATAETPSTSTEPAAVVRRYFEAVAARDLDGMVACWKPGGVENIRGQINTTAPEGVREFFSALFAAVPDFDLRVLDYTAQDDRVVARWEASGTFGGPTPFKGIQPNGRRLALEGCDVLVTADGLIVRNDAYFDGMELGRAIGLMPAVGSKQDKGMKSMVNLQTKLKGLRRKR